MIDQRLLSQSSLRTMSWVSPKSDIKQPNVQHLIYLDLLTMASNLIAMASNLLVYKTGMTIGFNWIAASTT